MPLVEHTLHRIPRWLWNAHVETIYPSQLRRVGGVSYQRERLELVDGDFLDLDWAWAMPGQRSTRLLVVCHGLEGDTKRHYVLGQAKLFTQQGWDVLAWNYRSCSGEMNRLPRLYHHGDTPDLDTVIRHALARHPYTTIALAGISMGGNILLKYLGQDDEAVPPQVIGAVAISAPVDLSACEVALAHPGNRIYMWRFLNKLGKKLALKARRFPGLVDIRDYRAIRRFRTFDDRYTAPLHGFRDANDYYARASAGPTLAGIRRPVLLLNAANDPFLAPACFPIELAQGHRHLHLEVPTRGGHVGFLQAGTTYTYAEVRTLNFLSTLAFTT